jgi:hypothetical protein
MQRNQFISYIRTVGLTIGMLLFVFLSYRSGQSATSKVAVQGKPSLWSAGRAFGLSNNYNDNLLASEDTLAAANTPAAESPAVSNNTRANGSDKSKTRAEQVPPQTDTSQSAPKSSNVGRGHMVTAEVKSNKNN